MELDRPGFYPRPHPEDVPHELRVLREVPRTTSSRGKARSTTCGSRSITRTSGRKCSSMSPPNRWRLAGSWIDAVDTNMPSPESLFRQALYAQRFFRQEFNGKEPKDIYLPDCFGFGFALPSIAAHSGLIAFSTQKLTWGRPIPFPIGRWKGVDGSEIIAELNPGSYGTRSDAGHHAWTSTNGGNGERALAERSDATSAPVRPSSSGTSARATRAAARARQSVQIVQKALATPPTERSTIKNIVARSAREGPDAGTAGVAAGLQRRADSEDAWHGLLHVAGRDEALQPRERAAGRCGGEVERGRDDAGRAIRIRPIVCATRGFASSGTSSMTTSRARAFRRRISSRGTTRSRR